MDLQYLLFLQENVRNETLTSIMMWFSDFAISFWLMAVVFCIYWCFNKKAGLFILTSFTISSLLNAIVKLSFCIYRPWIRNPNIIPASYAKLTAGGYSFPSGHTQVITSYFASSAFLTWAKHKWLSILFMITIFIVAFSRNYLGVHTPQDVVVGFILGCLSIYWASLFLGRDNTSKENDIKLLSYGIIIGIVSLLYFTLKNYPILFDAKGKLIVDPQKMMMDGFLAVGSWLAFIIGWFLEKHYVKFSTDLPILFKSFKAVLGLAIIYFIYYFISYYLYRYLPHCWARFLQWFLTTFCAIVVYPYLFKLIIEDKLLKQIE